MLTRVITCIVIDKKLGIISTFHGIFLGDKRRSLGELGLFFYVYVFFMHITFCTVDRGNVSYGHFKLCVLHLVVTTSYLYHRLNIVCYSINTRDVSFVN